MNKITRVVATLASSATLLLVATPGMVGATGQSNSDWNHNNSQHQHDKDNKCDRNDGWQWHSDDQKDNRWWMRKDCDHKDRNGDKHNHDCDRQKSDDKNRDW